MQQINLIGIPLDENSSYLRGSAQGPAALAEAVWCDSANLWTENGHDLAEVLENRGDIDPGSGEDALDVIADAAEAAARSGRLPIFLGGDHSVTWPLVRGMRRAVGDFAILHFDAHPDCYDDFEGNRFSHACPFSRIMEEELCSRLVSVGIRTASGHQREQRQRFGIEWLEMRDRQNWPRLAFDTPVYITLDLDVLDPAFAPGVSHHEPGGMSVREVIDVIQALDVPIVGADVVELNPTRDFNGVTAMVGAKLVREIAGMMLENG
ncbi:agmatinase [Pseudodesulfovibrio sp.]|uniref:agmatinase n=1 Tax=unclassified Pseudodesulfovibrio TaxID=2661612 RepID=UPI003B00DA61